RLRAPACQVPGLVHVWHAAAMLIPRHTLARWASLSALLPLFAMAQNAPTAPPKAALCTACHGPNGNATIAVNPILAGQTSRYLYLQLRDFQEDRRSDPQMTPIAKQLSRDEARELADYFAAQKPAPQPFKPNADKARLGKAKSDETLCTMCHLGGFAG